MLIAEGQVLLRSGIVRLLEDAGFVVVAQAGVRPNRATAARRSGSSAAARPRRSGASRAVDSVQAFPSFSRRRPVPRPVSVSNEIQAFVAPSADAGGSAVRKPARTTGSDRRALRGMPPAAGTQRPCNVRCG